VEKRDCATLCRPGKKWKVRVSEGEAWVVFGEKLRAGPTTMSWFVAWMRGVRNERRRGRDRCILMWLRYDLRTIDLFGR
jgi:hypothetical protein